MTKNTRLTLNGPLNSDALIEVSYVSWTEDWYPKGLDVAFLTDGLAGNGSPDNFRCHSSDYTVVLGPNGEAVVVQKQSFPLSSFAIPSGVCEVEEEAFAGLPINSVFVPDSCRKIDAGAFSNCASLKLVSLPKDCEIDDTAFDGTADQLWLFMPRGGTSQQWTENYALTHSCVVYPMDD